MSLGQRISERLRVLKLSQAELGRRAGVPQTTVNSLIKGKSRTTPHLVRIARALGTTPAYLTGESDDPSIDAAELAFSNDDLDWIELIHSLSPRDRNAVRVLALTLAGRVPLLMVDDDPLPVLQSQRLEYRGRE